MKTTPYSLPLYKKKSYKFGRKIEKCKVEDKLFCTRYSTKTRFKGKKTVANMIPQIVINYPLNFQRQRNAYHNTSAANFIALQPFGFSIKYQYWVENSHFIDLLHHILKLHACNASSRTRDFSECNNPFLGIDFYQHWK